MRIGSRARKALYGACSTIALMSCGVARAQSEQQNEIEGTPATEVTSDAVLPEVVVTARRKAETLRDVPVAVAVIGGDTLTRSNVTRITDLVTIVPTFSNTLTAAQPLTFIRGLGSGANLSFEQSVGKFIDNVSYGRDFHARVPLFDLERLEVLKGPQILLYGNSATAGALNITSQKPGNTFRADASSSYEFINDEWNMQAGVTVPLSNDISLRVAGIYRNLTRGWILNTGNNRYEPQSKSWAVRGTMLIRPAPDFEITLKGEFDRNDDFGSMAQPIRQAASPARRIADAVFDRKRNVNNNVALLFMDEYNRFRNQTYQADISYQLGGVRLNSTTALLISRYGASNSNHVDKPVFMATVDERYRQFSQELRASGTFENIDYLIGGYFQRDTMGIYGFQPLDLSPYGVPIPRFDRFTTFDGVSRTYSGFADVTWRFAPRWSIEAGARYSVIRKIADQANNPIDFFTGINFDTPRSAGTARLNAALNPAYTAAFGGIPHSFTDIPTREEHFQPQIVVQYKPDRLNMLYAKFVKGDKSGGVDWLYNGSVARGATVADSQFRSEGAKSFELGLKGATNDRRIEYGVNLFSTTFTDLQTGVFLGTAVFTTNAGAARSRGVDIDLSWAPADSLRIAASGTYLDARYTNFVGAACTVAQTLAASCSPATGGQTLTGARLPLSSRLSGTASITHTAELSAMRLITSADLNYRSQYNSTFTNDPLGDQKGVLTINANIDLSSVEGGWTLSVFGRNLSDRRFKEYGIPTPLVPGSFTAWTARGRQIGLRLSGQFR